MGRMEILRRLAGFIINIFLKKATTPLGFCDGLNRPFIGFGDDNGCQPPKYHRKYSAVQKIHKAAYRGDIVAVRTLVARGLSEMERVDSQAR